MRETKVMVLLDVDGVLNRFHYQKSSYIPDSWTKHIADMTTGALLPRETPSDVYEGHEWYTVVLNYEDREFIERLRNNPRVELMWGTTWMDNANEILVPFYNIEPLPVIYYGALPYKVLSYKSIDRPFIWIDDSIDDFDEETLARSEYMENRIVRIDPYPGLTERDIQRTESYVDELYEKFNRTI